MSAGRSALRIRHFLAMALVAGAVSAASRTPACSVFVLDSRGQLVLGFNENIPPMPGVIATNRRGLTKTSVSWQALSTTEKVAEPLEVWTSKYGSVAFTSLGREFPLYGLNEAGLFIVELGLPAQNPVDPSRPKMFWAQWIQMQLDRYASVEEVVKAAPTGPIPEWWPNGLSSHLFVADKSGATAVIALVNHKFSIFTGKQMPVKALCNTYYPLELEALRAYKRKLAEMSPQAAPPRTDSRFIQGTLLLDAYGQGGQVPAVPYMWKIIDRVWQGEWQTVVDFKAMEIQFRGIHGPNRKSPGPIKTIKMRNLAFSPGSPELMMDIYSPLAGDVDKRFDKWTLESNARFTNKGMPLSYLTGDNNFWTTPDGRTILKRVGNYPTTLK
jgi:hypothetical protein